ncbi:MAG: hypothetical protein ACOYOH_21915 [Paracraurococcus sp.]|jgi:hypothetical protein
MNHLEDAQSALVAHRLRQRSRGLQRLELQAPTADAPLLRAIAAALADPAQADAVRAFLRIRFAPAPPRSLKTLLEAAPLDDLDLDRSRDTGRAIDL